MTSKLFIPERPTLNRWLVVSLVYTALRTAVDAGSRWFTLDAGFSLWYPPVGVDVALLAIFGPWYTPALFLAEGISVMVSPFAPTLALAPIYVAAHVLIYGAVVGVILLRFNVDPRLPTLRDALVFILGTMLLLPLLSAFVKVPLLIGFGVFETSDFWPQVFALSSGDATGIAMVTPLLLLGFRVTPGLWWDRSHRRLVGLRFPKDAREWVEAIGLTLLTIGLARLAVRGPSSGLDVSYLMALPVIWVALRYGFAGAAVGVFVLNVTAALVALLDPAGAVLSSDPASIQLAQVAITVSGVLIGALVDEQRRSENNLTAIRRRYYGASNASPNAMVITSIPDFRIVEVNASFTRLSGYSSEEAIGKTAGELGLWQSTSDQALHRRSLAQGPTREMEFELKNRTGQVVICELSSDRFSAGDGEYFVTIARDVSEQRRLERELLEASEREQARLGRELHDHLGQTLTGISYLSHALGQEMAAYDKNLASKHHEVADHLIEAIRQLRTIARGLSPSVGTDGGLASALGKLTQDVTTQYSIKCTFIDNSTMRVLDPTTVTHLYRIVQEAVTNATRHGEATAIEVTLDGPGADRQFTLRIRDDGRGLTAGADTEGGLGLRNMTFRAGQIGGEFRLEPLDQGTEVCVTFTNRPAPVTQEVE